MNSYTCILMPAACRARFQSFGNESKAKKQIRWDLSEWISIIQPIREELSIIQPIRGEVSIIQPIRVEVSIIQPITVEFSII